MMAKPMTPADFSYRRLGGLLHSSRAMAAGTAALCFTVLTAWWRWAPGLVVAALGVAVLTQALYRRRRFGRSAAGSLCLDATAIAITVIVVQPPLVVILAPLASMVAIASLLLSGAVATAVVVYSVGVIGTAVWVVNASGAPTWTAFQVGILTLVSVGVFLPYLGRMLQGAARATAQGVELAERLSEREQRYHSLVEGIPMGVYRTSTTGEILEANHALVEMLGFPDHKTLFAEGLNGVYWDLVERDRWMAALNEHGVLRDHEARLRRRDGQTIWVRDSARVVTDSAGRVSHYEGTLEDITEEVRTRTHERAIASCSRALLTEASEEAIRTGLGALLEAAEAAFVFVERNREDPDLGLCSHLIYEANTLGIPPDYQHWGRVPWSKMPRAFEHLSRGKEFAFRVADLDGEERELYQGSSTKSELDVPIFIGDEWVGLIGVADVDEDRTWTDEDVGLLRTVGKMIGSSWQREDQRERLEQLVRSKDEFVASVSHELRTPLTAVLGFALELQNRRSGPAGNEEDELIDLIAREAEDLANLVQDLLVAARADIGSVICVPRLVDLRLEVDAVLSRFRPLPKMIEVEGSGTVWADPARLRQILRNLVSNALRYGGSNIEIEMTADDGHTYLQVRDDGPGVPQDDEGRLFDPYYRGQSASTQPVSVGLGLYVSRHLALLMGGDLVYRYENGRSVFEVFLPSRSLDAGVAGPKRQVSVS